MVNILSLRRRKNSKGAAAMLVTTAMALLFVVLVVALSMLSIREQRQAGDTDLSNRAIGLADAGIKDALARLKANGNYRENCFVDDKNGIICRSITDDPGPLLFFAQKDQPRKANIFNANYDKNPPTPNDTAVHYAERFEIYWCKADSSDVCNGAVTPAAFPEEGIFNATKMPPVLEIEFTYWQTPVANVQVNLPNNAKYNTITSSAVDRPIDDPSVVKYKKIVLYPNAPDVSPSRNDFTTTCGNSNIIKTGYYCKSNVVDLASSVYGDPGNAYKYGLIFSVTPRYRASYIEAIFYNDKINTTSFPSGTKTKGNIVPVPAASIVIDVTAYSGNLYRRLSAYIAKSTMARAGIYTGLYSGVDICKNMTVDEANNVKKRNSDPSDSCDTNTGNLY